MKRVWAAILMSVAVLLAISSCATMQSGPLEPGELKLLTLHVPENGNLKLLVPYRATITFKADGKPEIRRVCMSWSGDGPYCSRPKEVKYGSEAYIEVEFYARADTNRLECYAEYVLDGKVRRTNKVMSFVTGFM